MKKYVFYLTVIFLGLTFAHAESSKENLSGIYNYRYQKSFIFVEGGVTFSVFPDFLF